MIILKKSHQIALVILTLFAFIFGGNVLTGVNIAKDAFADDTVVVNASVGVTLTCTATPDTTTEFGTLTTAIIATSTPNATTTLDCNYAPGCRIYIYDAGTGANPALASSTAPTTVYIGSADNAWADNATLVAGTEGYGIKVATTSAGTGGTGLTVAARYNKYIREAVNFYSVGGLEYSSANQVQAASSSVPVSGRQIYTMHSAAVDVTTDTGTYTDTITYACTSN